TSSTRCIGTRRHSRPTATPTTSPAGARPPTSVCPSPWRPPTPPWWSPAATATRAVSSGGGGGRGRVRRGLGGGGADGADEVAAQERGDADVGAGVGGVDHVAGADVDADVVDGGRVGGVVGVEDQVARDHVGDVPDPGAVLPLLAGGAGQGDAALLVGAQHQPRAVVETELAGGAPLVGLAELAVGELDGRGGHPLGGGAGGQALAGGVGRGDGQDLGHVPVGVVVGEDRPGHVGAPAGP